MKASHIADARRVAVLATLSLAFAAACSDDAATPALDEPTALLSVEPAGGDVGVDVGTDVVVRFDHPVAPGMEAYAALHEGAVTGPLVAGAWTLSADRTTLTFAPDVALKPATTYVVHLGAGMMDGTGGLVDLGAHGFGMGGAWATGSMMAGGMGMGGGPTSGMTGPGWQHPTNGTYGMLFTFTTVG